MMLATQQLFGTDGGARKPLGDFGVVYKAQSHSDSLVLINPSPLKHDCYKECNKKNFFTYIRKSWEYKTTRR